MAGPAGIHKEVIKVTTTGSAGSATGSATSNAINGFIIGVLFDFTSAAATTDTTLAYASPAGGNIIVLTNANTDVLHLPRKATSDSAGAAISGGYDVYPVAGTLTLSVAQGDAATDNVVATVYYLRA